MSEAAALESLVQYLKHQRLITDYLYIIAAAILIYDYLLNLYQEITLIWFSRWNYTKFLFLLVRYLPIFCVYLELQNQLAVDMPVERCRWSIPLLVSVLTVAIFGADVVLTIRTWAVWRRDRRIGFALAFVLMGTFISSCVCNVLFLNSVKFSPPPYPGFRGCFLTHANRLMAGDWISMTVLNINVLSLMTISAFRAYKQGDMNKLSSVVHRDGIIFYFYLLAVSVANWICVTSLPLEFQVMLVPTLAAFYSSLTCRIVINIRGLGQQGTNGVTTVLHAGYEETGPIPTPLAYRPGTATPNSTFNGVP